MKDWTCDYCGFENERRKPEAYRSGFTSGFYGRSGDRHRFGNPEEFDAGRSDGQAAAKAMGL